MARILIIDDDLMVAQLLREHLCNEGYEVTTTSMAEDGYKSAVENPPDLIFLDVNLPDATGFQICGRFRMTPVTQSIPIIMMTGAARWPNQQEIGKRMGASEYILKPFNIIHVGERVDALMGSKRPARSMPEITPIPVIEHEFPIQETLLPEVDAEVTPVDPAPIITEEPVSLLPEIMPISAEPAPSGKERYFDFSVEVLILVSRLPKTRAGRHLADQLLQCGTAVGAKIQELRSAESDQEIREIESLAIKKLRETAYWLMLIRRAKILETPSLNELEKQCEELANQLASKNQSVL